MAGLRTQPETLQAELANVPITPPTASDLLSVIGAIADAMDNGMPSQRKARMQQLVSEIRVESRSEIFPTYRLPAPPVRVISGVVGRGGLEPPTSALSARRSASLASGPRPSGPSVLDPRNCESTWSLDLTTRPSLGKVPTPLGTGPRVLNP